MAGAEVEAGEVEAEEEEEQGEQANQGRLKSPQQ
jgi:hypothetical protein